MITNPIDTALANTDGKTLIVGNGSTWGGQPEMPISTLFGRLAENVLEPRFYDSSLYQNVPWEPLLTLQPEVEAWRGAAHFWGNFLDYSHGFNIITRDQELIAKLQEAINQNIQKREFVETAQQMFWNHLVVQRKDGIRRLLPVGEAEMAERGLLKGNQAYLNGSKIVSFWSKDLLIH